MDSQQVDAETKHGLPPQNRTPELIVPQVADARMSQCRRLPGNKTLSPPPPTQLPPLELTRRAGRGTQHSALITIDISSAPVFSDYEQRLDVVSSTIGSSRFKLEK